MYKLEIALGEDFEMESTFPNFNNPLKQKRFWVYKTIYKGKISYIVADMAEKSRYLFYDDNSKLGQVYMLQRGENFECEYVADFDDWNDFHKEFEDLIRMTNLVTIILLSSIEEEIE